MAPCRERELQNGALLLLALIYAHHDAQPLHMLIAAATLLMSMPFVSPYRRFDACHRALCAQLIALLLIFMSDAVLRC